MGISGVGFGLAFGGGNEEVHIQHCFLIHKRWLAVLRPKNFHIHFFSFLLLLIQRTGKHHHCHIEGE